jgi:gas vesicle protein
MEARSIIGGVLVGAALGVTAGLLMAPRSGLKTRKKLMKESLRLKKNMTDYIDHSLDTLRQQFNSKVDQFAKRGKDAIGVVSERVKV